MADDKNNIPDAGKVDNPPSGKGRTCQSRFPGAGSAARPSQDGDPVVEGAPLGKDEKQTTIPGMGDPAPAGKAVDFAVAREGAAKGNPTEKVASPHKGKQADKAKDAAKPCRGRPPKADKAAPDKAKPQSRDKMELLTNPIKFFV